MLFKIWQFIQLWLPFGLLLFINQHKKALPANIRMRTGRLLKAVMITTDYGILFSDEKYIENRLKFLKDQQQTVSAIQDNIVKEINSLDFIEREKLFGNLNDEV